MQHKIKWCYLCHGTENMTSDHVPPKNLFPEPRPTNLITVPCCTKCNAEYSKLDEQFRAFVTTAANASKAGKEIMRSKVFGGSFKRSPRLKERMRSGLQPGVFSTPFGKVDVPLITVERSFMEPFFVRMTKGLLATFYADVDYRAFSFQISQLNQFGASHPNFSAIVAGLKADERGAGVFRFWRGITPPHERPIGGLWIYQFYEAALFMVLHTSPLINSLK